MSDAPDNVNRRCRWCRKVFVVPRLPEADGLPGVPAVTTGSRAAARGIAPGERVGRIRVLTLAVLVVTLCTARVALAALQPDQRAARTAIVEAFGSRYGAALRVSWCESRWYPRAIGNGNVGVFQINYAAHRRAGESWATFVRRFSALRTNVAYAYRLSAGGRDWSAWSCRP